MCVDVMVATPTCQHGVTTIERLHIILVSFVAVFSRSDASGKGLKVNVMPLIPLVAARAGSQEVEMMGELMILFRTFSV